MEAKHFILRRYLQALAFKGLNAYDIAYVDGFSGPGETTEGDLSDTSFMIAIHVLKDAQQQVFTRTKELRHIRCFFSERDRRGFAQLQAAVAPFDDPANRFEIKTHHGQFEDAVEDIRAFVGNYFPLIFIDPTGWTGYRFDKTAPLFAPAKCEVLINFMHESVDRVSNGNEDEKTIASLDPILGGPGWRDRLDPNLPRGMAVEKLFRDTLKAAGKFRFAVSARVDKETDDRPHFFLAYATKDPAGLKAFRETEYDALRMRARNRANAKERKREEDEHTADLFAGYHADIQQEVDQLVAEQTARALAEVMSILATRGSMPFDPLAETLMEAFMLRETNIKDICVELAKAGTIANTWGTGNRKPKGSDAIRLRATSTR